MFEYKHLLNKKNINVRNLVPKMSITADLNAYHLKQNYFSFRIIAYFNFYYSHYTLYVCESTLFYNTNDVIIIWKLQVKKKNDILY